MTNMLKLVLALSLAASYAAASPEQPLDRSRPVPAGPTRPFNAPVVQESQLANGVKLAVAEISRLPIVSVDIVLPYAGAARDPRDKAGLSSLVSKLMMEGAGGLDSRAFAEALEDAGVSMGISLTDDAMKVSLFATRDTLDRALELAAKAVRRPDLPQPAFDRLKQEMQLDLAQQRGNPGAAAARRLEGRTYGPHPYGYTADEASIGAVQPGDVRAFAASGLRPEGAVISAAGDISPADFEAMVSRHFGDWRSQPGAALPAAIPAVPAAPQAGALVIDVIDMPGSQQSAIRVGQVQIGRNDPDYYAVAVMNDILGGDPIVGRISKNLREEKHWSYGAHLRPSYELKGGEYVIDADVQTDVTAPALQEVIKELRRMQDELVSDEELAASKRGLTVGYVMAMQKLGTVASRAADIETFGLPRDQMAQYRDKVMAVTAQQVQDAARAHLTPDAVQVVISGDAAKIVPELSAIAGARVRVFDVDGREQAPAAADAPKGAGR